MHSLSPLAATLLLLGAVHAADWPQWLGPERNGVSAETGLADGRLLPAR